MPLWTWLNRRRSSAASPPVDAQHDRPEKEKSLGALKDEMRDEGYIFQANLSELEFAVAVINPAFEMPPEIVEPVGEVLADQAGVSAYFLVGRLGSRPYYLIGLDFPTAPPQIEAQLLMIRLAEAVRGRGTKINVGVLAMNPRIAEIANVYDLRLYPLRLPVPIRRGDLPHQAVDLFVGDVQVVRLPPEDSKHPYDFVVIT